METLLWVGAFHLVCLGIFLLLASRAPLIEDDDVVLTEDAAELPFGNEADADPRQEGAHLHNGAQAVRADAA